ncbi:hypothetical protein [Paraburkholderia tropica]|uniref:hypothetical protein n=1 Tax=Paraburkholderia tropica TaxID=92647 RepID=UPI001CC71566|nr:hypothetical protein [Paraburkholderia tropica]
MGVTLTLDVVVSLGVPPPHAFRETIAAPNSTARKHWREIWREICPENCRPMRLENVMYNLLCDGRKNPAARAWARRLYPCRQKWGMT